MDRDEARALIGSTLVWDAHAGIFPSVDTDLSRITDWRVAGVDFVSINVGFDLMNPADTMATLRKYRDTLGFMSEHICLIDTLADVDTARSEGRLAIAFDIEGTNALADDISLIPALHGLGVRQMLLAYNLGNSSSGGCHDVDRGLTEFGRAVVAEMQRVGMTVDLSHMSKRATLDAIDMTEAPVVFTHSNPIAVKPHQRNIDDDQIRACARTGGVIGVNGMGIFLGENDTSAETFATHVSYLADLVGPAHVAFGLDWKPPMESAPDLGAILRGRPDYWPPGNGYDTPSLKLFAPSQLADVVVILASRGWRMPELSGFLGGNFRRVVERTWH